MAEADANSSDTKSVFDVLVRVAEANNQAVNHVKGLI